MTRHARSNYSRKCVLVWDKGECENFDRESICLHWPPLLPSSHLMSYSSLDADKGVLSLSSAHRNTGCFSTSHDVMCRRCSKKDFCVSLYINTHKRLYLSMRSNATASIRICRFEQCGPNFCKIPCSTSLINACGNEGITYPLEKSSSTSSMMSDRSHVGLFITVFNGLSTTAAGSKVEGVACEFMEMHRTSGGPVVVFDDEMVRCSGQSTLLFNNFSRSSKKSNWSLNLGMIIDILSTLFIIDRVWPSTSYSKKRRKRRCAAHMMLSARSMHRSVIEPEHSTTHPLLPEMIRMRRVRSAFGMNTCLQSIRFVTKQWSVVINHDALFLHYRSGQWRRHVFSYPNWQAKIVTALRIYGYRS